ncbi:MAG: hypothetical protein KDD62_06235 [Bdellovibrionales bacterium]|nr:hypothetical protein [Bdellovibrionales bacterium]
MTFSEFGGGLDSRFSPTRFLSSELDGPEKGYARGPERALLSALLFDGVQSFMNYVCADSEQTKVRYREAYNWVMSVKDDYVFAFENVCQALGVDPAYIRLGLINLYNSGGSEWIKARRNF